MRIKMAGMSDVGRVRKSNQDRYFCDHRQGLAIVCDGIGGRPGGDIAAQITVDKLRSSYLESEFLRSEEIAPFLYSAIDRANAKVRREGEKRQKYHGMGTTANFLLFDDQKLHIAHVGDSRTYLYEQSQLWQLTIDHNIDNFLRRGWIQPEEVAPGVREEALVRSVGLMDHMECDLYEIPARKGQIFITCSDGLSGMVKDRRILELVRDNHNNLEKLPKILIDEANRKGGRDNTTVVVTKVTG